MAVFLRLVSLILIVIALMLLGADAVTSLEKGGEVTVRSLDTVWGLLNQGVLDAFKRWVQDHATFAAQFTYSFLALPGWSVAGVIGVVLAFLFGRKMGPE
jgi:hypothetical protein